ncbi:MAG: hypothetical protein R3E78_05025 [Burkholderiaceae bacterium]
MAALLGPDHTARRGAGVPAGRVRGGGALGCAGGTSTPTASSRCSPTAAPSAFGVSNSSSPPARWSAPRRFPAGRCPVLNAGAAQIALKASGTVPDGRIVLAGTGPLPLLVACQLLDAGAQVAAVVETAPAANRRLRALPHSPGRFRRSRTCSLAWIAMLRRLRAARVPGLPRREGAGGRGRVARRGAAFRRRRVARSASRPMLCCCTTALPNTQLTRPLRG